MSMESLDGRVNAYIDRYYISIWIYVICIDQVYMSIYLYVTIYLSIDRYYIYIYALIYYIYIETVCSYLVLAVPVVHSYF